MTLSGDQSTGIWAGSWRRIIDEHLALALGNSFRQQLLWILNERVASPSELSKELGESLNKVCHHIDVLKKAGCIELAFKRTVGNRIQHFYRATARAFLDGTEWRKVPDTVKVGMRATLLENIINDAVGAVVNGTFDVNDDAHLSWTPALVDDQGREEVTETLERSLEEIITILKKAKVRLMSRDEAGTSYTVAFMGFSSVGGKKKVGPPIDATDLARSPTKATKTEKKTARGKRKGSATKKRRKATGTSKTNQPKSKKKKGSKKKK
jgi:DNA-binding transcriptional ArsR family regulator